MSDEPSAEVRIVITTTGPDDAAPLARALLERQLIGCANIVPGVRALYRWNDAIHDDAESLLWMETTAPAAASVVQAITELHGYDVPKVLVLHPRDVPAAYRAWLNDVVPSAR